MQQLWWKSYCPAGDRSGPGTMDCDRPPGSPPRSPAFLREAFVCVQCHLPCKCMSQAHFLCMRALPTRDLCRTGGARRSRRCISSDRHRKPAAVHVITWMGCSGKKVDRVGQEGAERNGRAATHETLVNRWGCSLFHDHSTSVGKALFQFFRAVRVHGNISE